MWDRDKWTLHLRGSLPHGLLTLNTHFNGMYDVAVHEEGVYMVV